MKANIEETDASRCFAHGVAHLLCEFGYEEGLALAGTVLHELFESHRGEGSGSSAWDPTTALEHGERRTPVPAEP